MNPFTSITQELCSDRSDTFYKCLEKTYFAEHYE